MSGLFPSIGGGGGSLGFIIQKLADTVYDGNSATYVDDAELIFNFEADKFYRLDFFLAGTISETSGIKILLTMALGGATYMVANDSLILDDDFTDIDLADLLSIGLDGHQGFSNPAYKHLCKYTGFMVTGIAGSLTVACAPQITGQITTLKALSFIQVTELI